MGNGKLATETISRVTGYVYRVEGQMSESNIKGLWNIMKSITGYGTQLGGDGINVDEANQFFARFDLFAYHRSILASLALSSSED